MEISLEKVDKVRERTGVSYGEAKKALEMCEGNVLDAIIFLEEKSNNEIKVSLRSKAYADVSKIAKVFGGGGHIRAAGCTINDSIKNAKLKIIEEALKEI